MPSLGLLDGMWFQDGNDPVGVSIAWGLCSEVSALAHYL